MKVFIKIAPIFVLLFVFNCRGNQTSKAGSCSVKDLKDGTVEVKCDDGSSEILRHGKDGKSCNVKKTGKGIALNCPPSTQWLEINHGNNGQNGKSCRIGEVQGTGRKYLTCDSTPGVVIWIEPDNNSLLDLLKPVCADDSFIKPPQLELLCAALGD